MEIRPLAFFFGNQAVWHNAPCSSLHIVFYSDSEFIGTIFLFASVSRIVSCSCMSFRPDARIFIR